MICFRCPGCDIRVPIVRDLQPWPQVRGRGVWRLAGHRIPDDGYEGKRLCDLSSYVLQEITAQ